MRIDPVIKNCGQRIRWSDPGNGSLKKVVKVEYPDCEKIDKMTRAEYHRWRWSDWPAGTRVWINGVRVR